MANKSTHTFVQSKMNKDLDARLLQAGEYRDGVNVSVSRSEADDVGALENIIGNEFLNDLSKNTNHAVEAIGWCIDVSTDRIFLFLTDYQDNSDDLLSYPAPENSFHAIVYFNTKTKTSQIIVQGSFLNFSINSKINDSNMIENLLFWTDNRNQPRKINVETAIKDNTYYYNEDHISVAKYYPYKAIELTNTIDFNINPTGVDNQVFFVDKNIGNSNGYDAVYDYFVVNNPSLSSTIVEKLSNNIGLKGYVEIPDGGKGFRRWEFKLAWFQKDGETNYLGTSSTRLPGAWAGNYMIFIDRDLSSQLTKSSDPTAKPALYNLYLIEETNKNVSSPWIDGHIVKAQAVSVTYSAGSSTKITFNTGSAADNPYLSALHLYGTRSMPDQVYNNYNGGTATTAPAFCIEDGFAKNTGDARNIFCRVNHPKLNQDAIYVITGLDTSNGVGNGFFIKQLESIENSSTLSSVDLTSFLSSSDILTIQLPNKFYSADFPGDPVFMEDKFIRFAYRFKYDDGEYSVVSPFTQEVFIPKQEGYFLADIGETPLDPANFNKYKYQIQQAGKNTDVDWFVNKVSQVGLKIPLEYEAQDLNDKLKVEEIDILYKESDGLALKVVKTIDVKEDLKNGANFFYEYEYNSEKPIKTIRDSEISRVYDNVPIRAKTQSTSGNRIIYGNFYDRHTSPLSLDFSTGVSSKFTPAFKGTTNSDIKYPNHTLKQNRTYQLGIILSDRYGRSSDVILSKALRTNQQVIDNDTPFVNNPINFGASTVYNPYFDNVNSLQDAYSSFNPTPSIATIKNMQAPRSGIIDWPGDSLKVLFNEVIPDTIDLTGYPGLYTSPVSGGSLSLNSAQFIVDAITTGNTYDIWEVTFETSGPNDQYKPGDILQWVNFPSTEIQTATIVSVELDGLSTGKIEVTGNYTNPTLPPTSAQDPEASVITAFQPLNKLGYYSYRFVVKQTEQSYYNVYLPSLLQGSPIPKPFKLFLEQKTAYTKVLTVDKDKHATPGTFPILEGMRLTGISYYMEDTPGNWVPRTFDCVVANILNDYDFEITGATGSGANSSGEIKYAGADNSTQNGDPNETVESEFISTSNGGTLNVTTLLTDNANKVPPALNEATPVQQQFATSEVDLIPRIAINNFTVKNGVPNTPPAPGGEYTRQIYPGRLSLKVRSLGNFEAMFVDGKYAGLWQADTDPPSIIVENKFSLGRSSQTALPINKETYQAAVYETTPTVSQLEIFYETSTSGKISDLNTFIRNNIIGGQVQADGSIEVEYFNSFWLKKIKTEQPSKTFASQGNDGSFTSPSRGVWPLSQVQASPQTNVGPGGSPVLGSSYGDLKATKSADGTYDNNWYLEESRIRGGYNNAEISLGARAFLDEEEPVQQHRFNSLIYSGVFNSRTGINRTNQFPVGTVITKSANPEYGSIQKIYAEETNLLVLQENKCQRALIDKDTIYTAEGGTQTQSGGAVIGQITPYAGEYGISQNPESFAIYSFQKYFIDTQRNAALRLSHNGVTEISEYGMRDWFRDNLADVNDKFDNLFTIELDSVSFKPSGSGGFTYLEFTPSNTEIISNSFIGCSLEYYNSSTQEFVPLTGDNNIDNSALIVNSIDNSYTPSRIYTNGYAIQPPNYGGKIKLISKNKSYIFGGWDIYNKQYVCSIQYNKDSDLTVGKDYSFYTIGFDEQINGWPSFYTYRPGLLGSLKNKFYTVNNFYDTWKITGVGDFGIYEQYKDNATGTNRGVFYGNTYPSTVTIIANAMPSIEKNFLTIDYEGSSGWKVVQAGSDGSQGLIAPIFSDETGEDFFGGSWQYRIDETNQIYSYYEGQYDSAVPPNYGSAAIVQPIFNAGFARKENRYVANLVNNSQEGPGEVIWGDKMSGIKGFYNVVTLSTDATTAPGKMKELYQVGLSYNISST